MKELADQKSAIKSTSSWRPFKGVKNEAGIYVPSPQEKSYWSDADELFAGGAGGGGKTGLIVGLALTAHQRSLILRRESTQLKEVKTQLLQWAPPGSKFRQNGPYGGDLVTPDGRFIELGGCAVEEHKRKYQGRPHDAKFYDEVTEFTESMYDFINGWNRTSTPGQRCRKVATGNPPMSMAGQWVIRRWRAWIDPHAGNRELPGKLRYYLKIEDKEQEFPDRTPIVWRGMTLIPQSRTFIPARLADNPMLRDTDYASKLALLPPALRDSLLYGDFGVSMRDDPWQVIPQTWIHESCERWELNSRNGRPLSSAGLDLSYGGGDRTVLARRYGDFIEKLDSWPGSEVSSGEAASDRVYPLINDTPDAEINCDIIGWGAAAYEALKRRDVRVNPINYVTGANGLTDARGVLGFSNMRAYTYWCLRDLMDSEIGGTLCLPPDPELIQELSVMRFELRGGKIFLRSKEEIAEAIGRSPDKADAVAMSCYNPPVHNISLGYYEG